MKQYFFVALIGCAIQFIVFKILYPFPDFISDSYSYIGSNLHHMNVNLWPIGYSKYLAIIHAITPWDAFLIFTQYLFLEASLLYFFFTVLYLFRIPRTYAGLLFAFLFFNPLLLYLSNCVLSDALFCSLSALWFTQMLWMLHKPKKHHVIVLSVLVGILFTLRYTAIYYPAIAVVAFILSKQPIGLKITGILGPLVFIIPFVLYTEQETKKITGTAQFSVFGGWQIANNALYMYDHIRVDTSKLPQGTQVLDRMVRQYLSAVPPEYRQLGPFPGTYFIKMRYAPLKQYMLDRYKIHDDPSEFLAWGKVSPMYSEYGSYLVKHYPLSFTKYYLWLNAKNYLIPHLEKFGSYNLGMSKVYPEAQYWFKYKSPAVRAVSMNLQGTITFLAPSLFLLLNVSFVGYLLYLLFISRLDFFSADYFKYLLLTCSFLFLNFLFSVFATPVVMRYQIFPMIICMAYTLVMMDASERRIAETKLKIAIKKDPEGQSQSKLVINH